jgi:hypothetical protein
MSTRKLMLLVWVCMACCLCADSSEIVFLGGPHAHDTLQTPEEIAAGFYGLNLTKHELRSEGDALRAVKTVNQESTLAVIISADALELVNRGGGLSALRRIGGRNVPVLVEGITVRTKSTLLREWSSEAIAGCEKSPTLGKRDVYKIKVLEAITRELSSQELPAARSPVCTLVNNGRPRAETLMTVSAGSDELPVFVRANVGNQELFFSAAIEDENQLTALSVSDQSQQEFSALAPLMMFLRYAGGEHAWHTIGHFANLTVDDAWLREPYGHLRYSELLREMQRHNFHTTIAFIPWNFDRSQAHVVSLFRANEDRFSICVHGNNHDHQEFGSVQSRPLEVQTANIGQALARMERFKSLTQLPYDRVMVFPHSIAPAETLVGLKGYNFLATVNSRDVPLGSTPPPDPAFTLRPMTLNFGNFPSFRRYSAEIPIPKSEIAVSAFLGNPILFYVHEAYFADGIDRFDSVAETVNKLQPDTLWRGLGFIAEHSYLERLRADGDYDIKAFSSSLQLENVHNKDAMFFIDKDEDFRFPLILLVDGKPYAYERKGDHVRFEVPVKAGRSRAITIEYQDNVDLELVDLTKSSIRVASLRYLSDFRDNVVSQSAIGRKLTRVYTNHEDEFNVVMAGIFATALIAVLATARRARRRRRRRITASERQEKYTCTEAKMPLH